MRVRNSVSVVVWPQRLHCFESVAGAREDGDASRRIAASARGSLGLVIFHFWRLASFTAAASLSPLSLVSCRRRTSAEELFLTCREEFHELVLAYLPPRGRARAKICPRGVPAAGNGVADR